MSKKLPVRKLELKGLSPLNKQKILAEKIYSPSSRTAKKNVERVPLTTKSVNAAQLFKKLNRIVRAPKSNDSSYIPTNNSATPGNKESKQKRGISLSSHPIKKLSAEMNHLRNFSVNFEPSVVKKYFTVTQTGFIPDYPQKENQDSFIESKDKDFSIFGVFDGHGVNGGEVSKYLKGRIPQLLQKHSKDIIFTIKNSIATASLEINQKIDTSLSGSTLNFVVIQGKKLFCANVGDSRSIIGNQVNDLNNRTSSGKK